MNAQHLIGRGLNVLSQRGALALDAAVLALALTAVLAGCTAPMVAPQASVSEVAQPFEQAADAAADALAAQLRLEGGSPALIIDPLIEAGSGQRSAATARLQQRVQARLAAQQPPLRVLPFERAQLNQASHVLTGTLLRPPEVEGQAPAPARIQLALTRLSDGLVIAQAGTRAQAGAALDMAPLAADQDSPVLARDRAVEGYVRTAQTPPGQPADRDYLQSLPAAPLVAAAVDHYEAGRFAEALSQYQDAASLPGGDQMRVFSGLYLSAAQLGENDAVRSAFRRIADHGLESRRLGVKFLFEPGGTAFLADRRISGPYGMWLQELAHAAQRSRNCLLLVGHASHTGSAEVNQALSQRRADVLRSRLEAEVPQLRGRLRTTGRSWSDNIIGTGTDDFVDALDRRVEFQVVDCAG